MNMKISKTILSLCLGVFFLLGSSAAQATSIPPIPPFNPGMGDSFTLHFDENGFGSIDLRDGHGFHADRGFAQLDPNTGVVALTYLLGGNIGSGVVDIFDSSGALSDAIDFYNIGANGYMAFYSTLPGNALADTISGGFVPLGFHGPTEIGGNFAYFSGGAPGINNDYYGVSGAPDGGSTVCLLGFAFLGLVGLRRRLGC